MPKPVARAQEPIPLAAPGDAGTDGVLRRPAELEYAAKLEALEAHDRDARPEGWRLSPRAVRTCLQSRSLMSSM